MEKNKFITDLKNAFDSNGYGELLDEKRAERLFRLADLLTETNKSFNLTAITEPNEIILKHFVDCATAVKYIPYGAKIIDVGCGAGFPSLPIAVLRDDVIVTALDSTEKKTVFISNAAKYIEIENIKSVAGRAEDVVKSHREEYDVAISRAVARLNILGELCIPFVKLGGRFIAMKSSKADEEHSEAIAGINKLGCVYESGETTVLSFDGQSIERENLVYKKSAHTPNEYPRNYGRIIKKPL